MGGEVYPNTRREISKLEATIRSHAVIGGGLVQYPFGDENRVLEVKQAQADLRETLVNESRKMCNARRVWQENITDTKVDLARNVHDLKCVEERIRKREAAKLAKSSGQLSTGTAVSGTA